MTCIKFRLPSFFLTVVKNQCVTSRPLKQIVYFGNIIKVSLVNTERLSKRNFKKICAKCDLPADIERVRGKVMSQNSLKFPLIEKFWQSC